MQGLEEECVEQISKALLDPTDVLCESKLHEFVNPAGVSEASTPSRKQAGEIGGKAAGEAGPGGKAATANEAVGQTPQSTKPKATLKKNNNAFAAKATTKKRSEIRTQDKLGLASLKAQLRTKKSSG